MADVDIHRHIDELVGEEHALRGAGPLSDEQRDRLRRVEEQLDQCWDLLRQRQALRDAGADADGAEVRPIEEVESYLQ